MDIRTDKEKGDSKLHNGYEIEAGIRGSKLSGGQKQRMAIARAIVRKPSILLLDEATSALDEESQRVVQNALENVMSDRTSLVIAHRLTTVEKCTQIAVIEDGIITETGDYVTLMNDKDGHFAKLAKGMN